MADYKADKITGKQRSNGGTFTNSLGGVPSITFNEELTVFEDGNYQFSRPVGSCSVELIDPLKALTLLNPTDDSVIGTATFQDVFVMLYSLYRQTADERDAANV